MNILLDTCSFLWIVSDSPELSLTARRLFEDPANDVYLSVASAWEIIVKHNLGKLPLPELPDARSTHSPLQMVRCGSLKP